MRARMTWPRSDSLSTSSSCKTSPSEGRWLAAAARSAAGEIHRSSLPRFSMLDMCRPHRGPRHRQELLLVAAEGESGKQQTFRRDAANVPACGPPGWGDRERANDIAAPMAAKAASRMMTSRLADNSCCGPAWSVLWPDPVRTASRHARSAEAPATPTLMPQQRTRLISPPASPVSDAGAALMMALLLGERKSPWPSPNSASASVTAGKLAGAPSSTANSRASAATQMSMPDTVSSRARGDRRRRRRAAKPRPASPG